MATVSTGAVRFESAAKGIPPLEMGDHLRREEFERRYDATPNLKKAGHSRASALPRHRAFYSRQGEAISVGGKFVLYGVVCRFGILTFVFCMPTRFLAHRNRPAEYYRTLIGADLR